MLLELLEEIEKAYFEEPIEGEMQMEGIEREAILEKISPGHTPRRVSTHKVPQIPS